MAAIRSATPTRTRRKYSFSSNVRLWLDMAEGTGDGDKRVSESVSGERVSKGYSRGWSYHRDVTDGDATAGFGGHRVIIALYLIVVAVAGTMGGVIGSIGLRDAQPVTFLGLVTFQPTPLGLAMFGVATVGTMLGAVLLLVVFVSRRYADE